LTPVFKVEEYLDWSSFSELMPLLWFELATLALLFLLLILLSVRRSRQLARQEKLLPPGHGFDTSQLQARVREVRQDYIGTAVPRLRPTPNHDLFALAVRRSLATLSYFRSAKSRAADAEKDSHESGG